MLKELDSAPLDIQVLDLDKKTVSLREQLGKFIVLYFYPKDNTPGCTTQACEFRDYNSEIEKLGAKIIGVSKDNIDSHVKFIEKKELNFELWSDPEHKLMEAFDTWGERKFMGKTYMGTSRSTFAINPEGKIIKVWEKAKPKENAKEVFEFLKSEIDG